MRITAIFREIKQDILTGTTHLVAFAILLTGVMTSFALADIIQIETLIRDADAYQKAGASISVLNAPGQINGSACEALSGIPGVRASGAVREEPERIVFTVLKSAPVPVSTVTPGFSELLGVKTSPSGIGVYLSDQVSEALQATAGDTAKTSQGEVHIGGDYVYPVDGRSPGYGYAALVPSTDTRPYDECWADIWPQSDEIQALMYTTVLAGRTDDDVPVVMGQLNTTLGAKFDGEALFSRRITRYGVAITGIAGLGIGYLYVRARRLEIASNLHAGVCRGNQAAILALEIAAWVAPALLLSEAILAFYCLANRTEDSTVLLLLGGHNQYACSIGIILGAGAAWITTREKHLFKYFKNR